MNEATRWGYYPSGDHQGNRANRFIAGIAFLDGKRPSAIMGRGYYARATVAAYTLEQGELVLGDTFDTETYPDPYPYHHKGAQTITVSDVDLDGKDEIVFGALTLEGGAPEGSTRLPLRMIAHASLLMLGWKLRGKTWPHPFFERATRTPSHPVSTLSPDEREALRAKCGPNSSVLAAPPGQ